MEIYSSLKERAGYMVGAAVRRLQDPVPICSTIFYVAFPFIGPRWLLQILPSVGNGMSLQLTTHWPEHSTWPYQAGDCDL